MAYSPATVQKMDILETRKNRPLTPEEEVEIILREKGRALEQIQQMEGWTVAMEMLESYSKDATDKAVETDPGDVNEVRANQAIAYAANNIYRKFKADVANAIKKSHESAQVFKPEAERPEHDLFL